MSQEERKKGKSNKFTRRNFKVKKKPTTTTTTKNHTYI
jgi:hypothetical protein